MTSSVTPQAEQGPAQQLLQGTFVSHSLCASCEGHTTWLSLCACEWGTFLPGSVTHFPVICKGAWGSPKGPSWLLLERNVGQQQ